ncbi:TRAP transporter 4TM/12TM fusion protein [Stella humosa]|uniref:TRAP transporter 4TM/12TM fusion protein n=1 Tax=Stella humosa TaxID=94 RepID=A0A3N1L852_9PROT|nr:TRAP transporter fused permease subunit [Stella humosa]ROP90853.1 TRAP transporter 4TM/12TM fusion protein [Stella humosa]BBK34798.1 C4-dicarboxylate ABC transporter permease [Stella humosa]
MTQAPPPSDAALALLEQDAARPLRDVIRHGAFHHRAVAAAIIFISLFLGVLLIYTAAAGTITAYLQRIAFVCGICSLGLLVRSAGGLPWHKRGALGLLPDLVGVALLIAGMLHVFLDYEDFARRIGFPDPADLFFGIVYIVVTLEVTRRFIGWAMLIIVALFSIQALFGENFPGMFAAPNVRWQTFVEILFMQDQGIFGSTTGVAATYLMLFLIFGAILVRTNGIAFFENLSLALMGRRAGGPAHVSVLSSALQGTTSGSVVGNVVGMGNVTIPLMIRSGFKPATAGAIEAVASSGAQIMPPVMGSAAFLMAAFLGVSYWTIVVAAVIPAVIYFVSIHTQVEFRSRRMGLAATTETLPTVAKAMREGGHLLIAIAALIAPFFFGFSAQMAALIGLGSLFAASLLARSTRIPMGRYLDAVVDAMSNNVAVGAAVATAGILMGTLWVSGAGNLLADFVVYASDGRLLVALILTAIIALVLGMGLPTPAVYLTVAVLIVPALVRMGAPELPSHMFAFYFGILANVTPPVALAAYAAASIAGADLNRTGYEAFILALSGFVVPFIFVYDPALLMGGSWPAIAMVSVSTLIAVVLLAASVEGWLGRNLTMPVRIMLAVATLCLAWPDWRARLFGLAIAAVAILPATLRRDRPVPAS